MSELTIDLTTMAHGGAAMGRDKKGRPIFVPYAIPGEKVRVKVFSEKKQFARAELLRVLQPVPDRIEPRCVHFTECGGCHWQHILYEKQLAWKRSVVVDQLQRIGGLSRVNVQPTLPNPDPWASRNEVSLSPTIEGGLGFWSPSQRQVIPIETCHVIRPELLALWQDIDMDLPGLRKLTLRLGDDGAMLAAFEIDGVEPPDLSVDFPLSVAIVLPDKTAASLVGDHYLVQRVNNRDFRVSPGCYFASSLAVGEQIVATVLAYADLTGNETVLEAYSGVGMLTAFLAPGAVELIAIEQNPDAVADTAVNLAEFDQIRLYEGDVADVLPLLDIQPDIIVVDPSHQGLGRTVVNAIADQTASRLIYVSNDLASLARDAKGLARSGYHLQEVQPIDMMPHHFQVHTVSIWMK